VVSVSRRQRGDAGGPAVVDGVPVVVTDSMGPATVGLFRSRVLVPRWVLALPGVQRQYVLRHEEEHRRSHDARLLFVASLPLILMPWNLALWWQLRRLCLAVEMDCDNRVVSRLGDATAYGELLLKVAQAASRGPRLQPALLGGMGSLERRLTALLAPTPLRYLQRFLLPAVAIGLLFVVLLMPHPVLPTGPHAHVTTTSGATTTTPTLPSQR
jgi:beta-lactamase regulating signal transducer with metallopeptidase domain